MLEERHILTIGQAVEALGVSTRWLRFGERLESLPPAQRSPCGDRPNTEKDIANLRRLGVGERKRRPAAAR